MKKHLLTKTFLFLAFLIWANVGWAQYSGTGTFKPITSVAEIESGTYYVFYGMNTATYTGAMTNTITSGRMGNTAVTLSGSDIVDPSTAIVWKVEGDATNGYTVYNEAISQYCEITVNSTSGFTLSAVSTHKYNVSASAGAFSFASNSATGGSRCISIYQSDWRPYATPNTLVLYKLFIDNPPIATWNPTDTETGVDPASNITITFDEKIYQSDGSTEIVDGDLATLITFKTPDALGTTVPATMTYDNTTYTITIDPTSDLEFNTDYYVAFGSVYDDATQENSGENITFTTKPETDKDSKIIAPSTQVAAATVESIETDSIPVFAFTVSDLGTLDGLATKVTQLTLKAGPNNTIAFNENISGGCLLDATDTKIPFAAEPIVTASEITITFNADDLNVADLSEATYTVYLYIDTLNSVDGSIIQLMIDGADHGVVADATGSEFAADFGADVIGENITINVTATDLNFFSEPVNVYAGSDIEPSVKVTAIDVNGNVDTDYITDISLTATGATLVGSPVTATPVMGKATFSSVSFSNAATGVTLTATSGTLTEKVSATFDVIAVPATDLFFSEYIEGSANGNNRAFEIYNPTSESVDLSAYVVQQSHGGTGWGVDGIAYVLPLEGTLAAGEVYVVANIGADEEILAVADSTFGYSEDEGHKIVFFTGDDALGLFKIVGEDTVLIDVIGEELEDPGFAWDVAGVTEATGNHTLLRKVGTTHGTIDWPLSAGTTSENSEWKVFDADFVGNIGAPTPDASSETAITKFTFGHEIDLEDAVINDGTSTIDITVINGTVVTALVPTITLSEFATIDPLSGVAQDFTLPVVYVVTAEDAITTEDWTINVTVSPTLSTYANILEMEVEGSDSIIINEVETSVNVYVPYGFDVTSIKPTFAISGGATIVDTTLALDFTTPQTYTVTAQDGTTYKDWEVTFTAQVPIAVTIYDIQYTTDVSGDSPYLDKLISTSGIVTAIDPDGSLWIQDGTGAWNGVYIYSSSTASAVSVGDNIEFAAEVDEYFNLTELKNVVNLNVTSSGNTLPAVTEITTVQANLENYEGVLVKISNATCTNDDAGNGMFEVNDGSGAIKIDDDLFLFTPTLDINYDITGLGHYSYSEGKIIPRSADDIQVSVGLNNPDGIISMNIFPNPNNGLFTLEINNTNNEVFFVEVYDVIGKMVYNTKVSDKITNINLTEMSSGIYYVSIKNSNNRKVSKILIQ